VGTPEAARPLEALLTDRGQLPRNVALHVLSSGGVMVNRRRVSDPKHALKPGDEVVAHVLARGEVASGPRPLARERLLLLDDQLVAVDKPPGIPAQATETDTAAGLDASVKALLLSLGEKNPMVGLVHRLDLETSGVTLFGRTPDAIRSLSEQFRTGAVQKRYEMLISGAPPWTEQLVDGPIAADDSRPGAYCVSPRGRPARTRFLRGLVLTAAPEPEVSRLEALPETGRTHQIRVHAATLGFPLLGDRRYGGPAALTFTSGHRVELARVALHAAEIRFAHPTRGACTVRAAWPADLMEVEEQLRATLQKSRFPS
jgi:23S rRNA pseudouridine1911/1915/1917 synthase